MIKRCCYCHRTYADEEPAGDHGLWVVSAGAERVSHGICAACFEEKMAPARGIARPAPFGDAPVPA